MIDAPTIGSLSLHIALLLSIIIPSYALWQYFNTKVVQRSALLILWSIELLMVASAFLSLTYCFAASDFSVVNVVNNSHSSKPLIYKISAAWGNHEGSMLLWVSCLALSSVLFAYISNWHMKFVATTLLIQSLLMACFLSFIIFASNPFLRMFPAAINGFGLNPILQDIGLAAHPPMLYLGYVGFSIVYSSAIAGLWHGEINQTWAKSVRPWALFSWSFLTLGITLGSWWAYRELGWGGFWFWDPVENSSLMPWLMGCALIHSLLTLQTKGLHANWCYILGTLTFTTSVIGTFIVRSGLVTSVHAFANDPTRGMFILSFITLMMGGAILLHIRKGSIICSNTAIKITAREGFIYWNNLLLCTAAFTVALGTLYPKILELTQGILLSVGAPYFNQMFGPLAVALGFLCILGTRAKWGISMDRKTLYSLRFNCIATAIAASIALLCGGRNILCILGVMSGTGLFFSQLFNLKQKRNSTLAHLAFAILMISISINTLFQYESEQIIKIGEKITLGPIVLHLNDINLYQGKNYLARRAIFNLEEHNHHTNINLMPETRFFPVEAQQTTEAAIHKTIFYDVYVAVGQMYESGEIVVRAYIRPMISGIWLSGILITISGLGAGYSILSRRRKI